MLQSCPLRFLNTKVGGFLTWGVSVNIRKEVQREKAPNKMVIWYAISTLSYASSKNVTDGPSIELRSLRRNDTRWIELELSKWEGFSQGRDNVWYRINTWKLHRQKIIILESWHGAVAHFASIIVSSKATCAPQGYRGCSCTHRSI